MPTGLLSEIIAHKPQGAMLGLDIGTKTIGLAMSDPAQSMAMPLTLIERTKFTQDIKIIQQQVESYDIKGFVLGWPLNMDGSRGPRCDAVHDFARELANYPQIVGTNPWIALWDERLSTASVERFLVDSVDMSRTKRKQAVDKLAAQHILQGALDFMRQAARR